MIGSKGAQENQITHPGMVSVVNQSRKDDGKLGERISRQSVCVVVEICSQNGSLDIVSFWHVVWRNHSTEKLVGCHGDMTAVAKEGRNVSARAQNDKHRQRQ